ncbi:hypothetical protein SK128_011785 [Halocaridina rubra]|uniref:Uncharacterized protein n=1 Tax=Halocaridina rubra TaxID=373956 RepID=A0AAN8X0D0_HALRR
MLIQEDLPLSGSYRPIYLLSTTEIACKKLAFQRLYWFLEIHDLLPLSQAGFQKNCSTIDQLVRQEHTIQGALKESSPGLSFVYQIYF